MKTLITAASLLAFTATAHAGVARIYDAEGQEPVETVCNVADMFVDKHGHLKLKLEDGETVKITPYFARVSFRGDIECSGTASLASSD